MTLLLAVIAGCDLIDDRLYHASKEQEKSWNVGSVPEVVADVRGGPIYVIAGSVGKITASWRISWVSKISQQVADEAVNNAPDVLLSQEGDSIRITEPMGKGANCSLVLSVPPGTRLDLRAGQGDVCVGFEPRTGQPMPIAPGKIDAKSGSVVTLNILHRLGERLHLDLEGFNPKLTLDGIQVGLGPPVEFKQPGGAGIWHYRSE